MYPRSSLYRVNLIKGNIENRVTDLLWTLTSFRERPLHASSVVEQLWVRKLAALGVQEVVEPFALHFER